MLKKIVIVLGLVFVLGVGAAIGVYKYIESSLPKLMTVNDYSPLLVTQVYDRNGKKIGEFFRERRVLVPYKQIPKDVVNAFLAAEDDQFFKHGGINYLAIMRATIANLRAGHTVQGGSTITQQVAKTFFLSSEKTLVRKLKEAVLAQSLEGHMSKEDILFLYLNQIYFGQSAYGIGLAAETYFRKPVAKLSLAEIAILAGLPKAPSAYSPVHNPGRAKERQVYVLNRMAEVGFITKAQAEAAAKEPVKVYLKENYQEQAPFFLETIRTMLTERLGEEAVLDKGLKVYTGLDLPKQLAAQEAVELGLRELDKRQGYRGPLRNTVEPKEVGEFLLKTRNTLIAEAVPERVIQPDGRFTDYGPLKLDYDVRKSGLPFYLKTSKPVPAIVSRVDDELGLVFVRVAELEGIIDLDTMKWARKPNAEKRFDQDLIQKPSQALKMGDVISVRVVDDKFYSDRLRKLLGTPKKDKKGKPIVDEKTQPDLKKYVALELEQAPLAESALLSFDQQTNEVIAMVGGYNFEKSQWNKALQAARQTGSSFKTIVYASALDKGYTPASPIMDAPIVYEDQKAGDEDSEGQDDTKTWKPSNHSKSFGGDILFRNALVKSLNIPTVKIIEDITVPWATEYAKRMGVFSPLNPDFTLALGSSSVTLYEMTKVFSQFGKLGKRIRPILIHKVEDSKGKKLLDVVTIDDRFKKETEEMEKQFEERRLGFLESLKLTQDATAPNTEGGAPGVPAAQAAPQTVEGQYKKKPIDEHIFFEEPDQLIKPTTAYLMTSLLKAVVEDKNGTGGRARALGREVAGKTGTTNGYYDAWFLGYSAQIATGVWVGHEQEKTLGKGEVGGRSALPIWVDYMKAAHEGLPQMTLPVPAGIVFANIDSETGQLASASSKNIIRQAFLEGTEPTATKNKKEEDTDFYKQDMTE
ncbi:MAG: penicillin-binding protein 1A [Oligoflexia bacterium]|nr:MAG: penicillin-binding protein 1A [Oligoflexia bacterium]